MPDEALPGVKHLLGYSEPEWVGQHACMMFSPEDQAVAVCKSEMQKAQETGCATDIRWHRHKNGTEFFANGFMNAVRDESGVLLGYAKIMSDETARKQLQDALTGIRHRDDLKPDGVRSHQADVSV